MRITASANVIFLIFYNGLQGFDQQNISEYILNKVESLGQKRMRYLLAFEYSNGHRTSNNPTQSGLAKSC